MTILRQVLLGTLALAFTQSPALAQSIDIKGVRAGMSQFEIQDLHGQLPLKDFTVAGVPSKHTYIDPDFLDGKLQRFEFYFSARSFSTVASAIRKKIPSLRCTDSQVTTALGKATTQTHCRASDKYGDLTLIRFDDDILTSSLTLRSTDQIRRDIQHQRAAEKDI